MNVYNYKVASRKTASIYRELALLKHNFTTPFLTRKSMKSICSYNYLSSYSETSISEASSVA